MKDFSFVKFLLDYRDVFLAVLSFFGIAWVWRYIDRKPYVKAALIEDFRTELMPDLAPDNLGIPISFVSRQYRLRLTIHPTKCRSELVELTASSGKLCPTGEWLYREDAERGRAIKTRIIVDPSDISPSPVEVEFQFLPDEEEASSVRFSMNLSRRLFSSVPVHLDYVGPDRKS